ncbi:unnamed protein product [Hermetia illucens]|uniref:Phosphatidylethanolamine-binding protein n=1 Tax=Hermetia illucens TaxID=343691 RepID=A0A7R8UNU2_HERIL|nr:protein D3-like [Hermetia illucens]CAD7084252.1 unnamed protein product [Hermetia illucens]
MEKHQVVPDIIDRAPKATLEISYPSGVKVDSGNELTPTQVKDKPKVTWDAESGALYTLLMTDPDAPSRQNPTYREVRHWLVVNIPGNKLDEGQVLIDFVGSGPPADTGLHRYVFLLFKQKGKIVSNLSVSNRSREGRMKTSTRELIKEFNLGDPVAGNLYQAQYDDYVRILHEQLAQASQK